MDASQGLPAFPAQPPRVEARFEGEIHGPVAVENYGLQIGSNSGVVINLAAGERPVVQPKPGPVAIRGRRFNRAELLDRTAETGAASAASRDLQPVELYGESGVGKTTLLRYLAWSAAPDVTAGVLSYRPRQEPPEALDDVLQYVFEQFFDASLPLKLVRTGDSRRYLNDLSAFVLLDDVGLSGDEVRWLLEALPNCAIVLASSRAHLSRGEGQPIAVKGLPLDAALAVLERELGRPLAAAEIPLATELCQVLGGRPEALVALAREVEAAEGENPTLDAFLGRLRADPTGGALTRLGLGRLVESEQKALATLVAHSGASVRPEHVGAIAGVPDAGSALGALAQRQLAEEDGAGYRASAAALAILPDALRVRPVAGGSEEAAFRSAPWDVLPWVERALAHWLDWAEAGLLGAGGVREDVDAALRALSRAAELRRWESIRRLGRAIEGALIASGRWGAWERALGWMLEAARGLGDRAAEAYALHQLGSRALCLGDAATTRSQLEEALRIRRALRDREGIQTTRHNLGLLRPRPARLPWVLGSILLVLALTLGVARALPGSVIPTPSPTPGLPPTAPAAASAGGITPSSTATPSRTATRAPTVVERRTPTWTPTPTPTGTATTTRSPTVSPTTSATGTRTPTPSPSPSPSSSPSPTSSATRTATPTAKGGAVLGQAVPIGRTNVPVLAMYYAWYDQNEWTRGETSDSPIVPYNSDDSATIDAQVREAASLGINGFELDWLGPDNPSIPSWPGGRTDRNLRKLLSIAARYDFKATADYDVARAINAAPGDLATGLKYLRDTYTGDPAWFRFQGKPVVVFFHVARYPVQTWQAIRDQVDPNRAMYWIGEGDNFSYVGVFDGMHAYDLHWSANPSAQLAVYAQRTRQNGGKIWMATTEPGYDDHLSSSPNPPVVDRQNGAYYRAMWQGALATCPDIISITSWNEWVEGHYVEPSQKFGTLFVDITRELIGKLRGSGMPCAGPG